MPSSYRVFVPVELVIELEARDADNAFDRAQYVADGFIKGALPYKLGLPGVPNVTVTIGHAPEDDDQPAVIEIKRTATTSPLGALPTPQDYAAPHYGVTLVPADHPSRALTRRVNDIATDVLLGGSLRGEEWGV